MAVDITRPGIVVPVRVDPTGNAGPTRGQARGPRWRRVGPGWYVPTEVDGASLDQRIVEAVVACGPTAAATGWAGLAWQRGRWFNGLAGDGRTSLPVPVALGDRRTIDPRHGIVICDDWLFDDDVIEVDGLPITVAERSVSYEVRRARRFDRAVQQIDMAAADDLVDVASMTAFTARLAGRPGVKLLRLAVSRAEENVWSIQEVPMRLQWQDDRPGATVLCNVPIFDREGQHLMTPDLLDPDAGVAGEYDGVVHLDDDVRRRDLNREALCRDLDIEVVTMMSADRRDMSDFRSRLERAYRRAGRKELHERRWTLEQPAWWVDTSTVARRRALGQAERAVWLRRRTA